MGTVALAGFALSPSPSFQGGTAGHSPIACGCRETGGAYGGNFDPRRLGNMSRVSDPSGASRGYASPFEPKGVFQLEI